MVAPNLKADTLSLMDKRTAIEAEMNKLIASLSGPSGAGLAGNLVDSEGFPRADIDIPAARAERRQLAELRNDHKALTATILENMQILHSAKLANGGPQRYTVASTPQSSGMDKDGDGRIPFALVDEIEYSSPAAIDGLQLGDEILKFGNVVSGRFLLSRLSSEAQSNVDCPIPLVIMRQGVVMNLSVTPRIWNGHGLLGCHFRMMTP